MGKTVRTLLEERLGVAVTARRNRATSSVGTTAGQVLRQDPSRIAFLFVNLGAFDVLITPLGAAASTNGVRLGANGGSASAQWDEDGEVVAWEWNGIAIGGASAVLILEFLVERPQPESEA